MATTVICVVAVGGLISFSSGGSSTQSASDAFSAMAVEATDTDVSAAIPSSTSLSIDWIGQWPELPTGCEITSATMMLNYYGFDEDNTELNEYLAQSDTIDTYTELGKRYGPDPDVEFIGSTYSTDGCYCNPSPIVAALNSYLAYANGNLTAENITGYSPSQLYQLVSEGNPVEAWVTIDMQKRQVTDSWYSDVDGSRVQIDDNDHAMVLIGYTDTTVTLADPLQGIVTYSKSAFEFAYRSRGEMAVTISNDA